jgi:hypothetical protein
MIPEGTILWQADAARRDGLNLTRFLRFLKTKGNNFDGYQDLWQWSVTDRLLVCNRRAFRSDA